MIHSASKTCENPYSDKTCESYETANNDLVKYNI